MWKRGRSSRDAKPCLPSSPIPSMPGFELRKSIHHSSKHTQTPKTPRISDTMAFAWKAAGLTYVYKLQIHALQLQDQPWPYSFAPSQVLTHSSLDSQIQPLPRRLRTCGASEFERGQESAGREERRDGDEICAVGGTSNTLQTIRSSHLALLREDEGKAGKYTG